MKTRTREQCLPIAKRAYKDILESFNYYKKYMIRDGETDGIISRFDGSVWIDDHHFIEEELIEK